MSGGRERQSACVSLRRCVTTRDPADCGERVFRVTSYRSNSVFFFPSVLSLSLSLSFSLTLSLYLSVSLSLSLYLSLSLALYFFFHFHACVPPRTSVEQQHRRRHGPPPWRSPRFRPRDSCPWHVFGARFARSVLVPRSPREEFSPSLVLLYPPSPSPRRCSLPLSTTTSLSLAPSESLLPSSSVSLPPCPPSLFLSRATYTHTHAQKHTYTHRVSLSLSLPACLFPPAFLTARVRSLLHEGGETSVALRGSTRARARRVGLSRTSVPNAFYPSVPLCILLRRSSVAPTAASCGVQRRYGSSTARNGSPVCHVCYAVLRVLGGQRSPADAGRPRKRDRVPAVRSPRPVPVRPHGCLAREPRVPMLVPTS